MSVLSLQESREALGEELEPPHVDGSLSTLLDLVDLAARSVYAWREGAEQEYGVSTTRRHAGEGSDTSIPYTLK